MDGGWGPTFWFFKSLDILFFSYVRSFCRLEVFSHFFVIYGLVILALSKLSHENRRSYNQTSIP